MLRRGIVLRLVEEKGRVGLYSENLWGKRLDRPMCLSQVFFPSVLVILKLNWKEKSATNGEKEKAEEMNVCILLVFGSRDEQRVRRKRVCTGEHVRTPIRTHAPRSFFSISLVTLSFIYPCLQRRRISSSSSPRHGSYGGGQHREISLLALSPLPVLLVVSRI